MDDGHPSFFQLFKRGHYYRLKFTEEDTSKEAEKWREERERFAVSAIAFCLQHDPVFCEHFWQSICKVQGDPEQMPQGLGVRLEPADWADLSLAVEMPGQHYVWVVEVKAGARLEEKQNPTTSAFKQRNFGSGWFFADQEAKKRTKMRYIVLGAEEELLLKNGDEPLGITVQQRGWEQLLYQRPRNPLIDDLVESLSKLNINAFIMEQAKKRIITTGLSSVGQAWEVIEGVCDALGVKRGCRELSAGITEGGIDELGAWMKSFNNRGKPSLLHKKLTALAGPNSGQWFGYLADGKAITKVVYLWSTTAEKRDVLLKKLSSLFPGARPEDKLAVVVRSSSTAEKTDFEWFLSVFNAAIK